MDQLFRCRQFAPKIDQNAFDAEFYAKSLR